MTPSPQLLAFGNAIVDVLARATDQDLDKAGVVKGSMTLIDETAADQVYGALGPAVESSGGSAANTAAGFAMLGGATAYVGKVAEDVLGGIFRHDIRAAGVSFETPAATSGPGTARCLIMVTPDGQRTMRTYLGACVTLGPEDVDEALVAAAGVTYIEGYLWDEPRAKEAIRLALAAARRAGRTVALSLSDPFCVARHRDEFLELVADRVDLLFANQEELLALTGAANLDDALASPLVPCRWLVATRGPDGAVVRADGRLVAIPAEPVDRVEDTTGAGDLFAAGFLFGYSRGLDPETCARLGAICAAECIEHMGARPQHDLKALVRDRLGQVF